MTRATKAKELPVNREPFAEFLHSFLRPGLCTAGHSGPGVWTFQGCGIKLRRWFSSRGSAAFAWPRVGERSLDSGPLRIDDLLVSCFAIPVPEASVQS